MEHNISDVRIDKETFDLLSVFYKDQELSLSEILAHFKIDSHDLDEQSSFELLSKNESFSLLIKNAFICPVQSNSMDAAFLQELGFELIGGFRITAAGRWYFESHTIELTRQRKTHRLAVYSAIVATLAALSELSFKVLPWIISLFSKP